MCLYTSGRIFVPKDPTAVRVECSEAVLMHRTFRVVIKTTHGRRNMLARWATQRTSQRLPQTCISKVRAVIEIFKKRFACAFVHLHPSTSFYLSAFPPWCCELRKPRCFFFFSFFLTVTFMLRAEHPAVLWSRTLRKSDFSQFVLFCLHKCYEHELRCVSSDLQ